MASLHDPALLREKLLKPAAQPRVASKYKKVHSDDTRLEREIQRSKRQKNLYILKSQNKRDILSRAWVLVTGKIFVHSQSSFHTVK